MTPLERLLRAVDAYHAAEQRSASQCVTCYAATSLRAREAERAVVSAAVQLHEAEQRATV